MSVIRMNGCYNRAPLKDSVLVQDGYFISTNKTIRTSKVITIPDPMSKECQYSIHTKDERCTGCKWQQS